MDKQINIPRSNHHCGNLVCLVTVGLASGNLTRNSYGVDNGRHTDRNNGNAERFRGKSCPAVSDARARSNTRVGKLNGSTRIIEINSFNLRINGVSEDVNDLELLKEL